MRSIHEATWWGLERYKPAAGETYRASVLLLVCLAYGLPLAAFAFILGWGATAFARSFNPLIDDSGWLPRGLAWSAFVLHGLMQGVYCWMWNRGLVRTSPSRLDHTRLEVDHEP